MNRFIYGLALLLIVFGACQPINSTTENYISKANAVLDDALVERKMQLTNYLLMTQNKAASILQDAVMGSFFKSKLEYFRLSRQIELPASIVSEMNTLKQSIQKHYVQEYLLFHDILFVDKQGDIFYTIRKENDYHKNIFSEEFASYALAQKLADNPGEAFVDFEFYAFSDEPSAFFIEPYRSGKEVLGWFVLQFAVKKIDNLFADNAGLGATGEVILVNKAHYMLTNSRFKNKKTILRQQLKSQNIESKFQEKKGHKEVIDYNGNKVLSSFEVFNFLGNDWLLIAKMNTDEALTNYYKENPACLEPIINAKQNIVPEQKMVGQDEDKCWVKSVDMDEFHRIDSAQQILHTQGISTCTAVVIENPGSFAYLAHISPYDAIYGNQNTDMLGQMLKRINYFDIKTYEKSKLKFIVVAVDANTMANIVKRLVDEGFLLGQIKFLHNSQAQMASVDYYFNTGQLKATWINRGNSRNSQIQFAQQVASLGHQLSLSLN